MKKSWGQVRNGEIRSAGKNMRDERRYEDLIDFKKDTQLRRPSHSEGQWKEKAGGVQRKKSRVVSAKLGEKKSCGRPKTVIV